MADYQETVHVNIADHTAAPLRRIAGSLADIGKLAAGFVIGGALTSLPGYLLDSAKAAADDASSMAKLQQAVENSGASWADYSDSLNTVIDAGIKRGFTDDAQRDSLALLVAQTGSAEEAQKRLGLAMDLSRGANIDLTTASKLLGKVTDDNVSVLGRYGISVKKGASQAQLFGAIQAKFGGQADTFAKSTAGQMEILSIQMGELKEQIGYLVLPILTKLATFANAVLVPLFANRLIPAIGDLGALLVRKFDPAIVATRALFVAFTRDAGALGIVMEQVRRVFGKRVGDFLDPFVNALMRAIPTLRGLGGKLVGAFGGGISWTDFADRAIGTLQQAWTDASARIDLAALAQMLADRLAAALRAVDWSAGGQAVTQGLGDATTAAANAGGAVQQAAESNASAYVDAFGAKVAASKPISLPGMDKSLSFAGIGKAIQAANGPLGQFGVTLGGLAPLLTVVAVVIPRVAPLITVLGAAISAAGAAIGVALSIGFAPLALAILGIAAAVAAMYVIWTNDIGGIQEIAAAVIPTVSAFFTDTLLPAVQSVLGWIQQNAPPALAALRAGLDAVWGVVQLFLPSWAEIEPHARALQAALADLVTQITPAAQAFAESLGPAVQEVGRLLHDVGEVALPLVSEAAKVLAPVISQVLTIGFNDFLDRTLSLVDGLRVLAGVISDVLTFAINNFLDTARLFVQILTVGIPVALAVGRTAIESITATVGVLRDAFHDVVQAIRDVIALVPQIPSISIPSPASLIPHAAGGPVMAGRGYLVGERGPEPFFPSTNGVILPNGSGGGGDTHLNVTLNYQGAPDASAARRMAQMVMDEMHRELTRRKANVLAGGGAF